MAEEILAEFVLFLLRLLLHYTVCVVVMVIVLVTLVSGFQSMLKASHQGETRIWPDLSPHVESCLVSGSLGLNICFTVSYEIKTALWGVVRRVSGWGS